VRGWSGLLPFDRLSGICNLRGAPKIIFIKLWRSLEWPVILPKPFPHELEELHTFVGSLKVLWAYLMVAALLMDARVSLCEANL
jgi:hypothetical protein